MGRSDPLKYRIDYLVRSLTQLYARELAIAQIWTPTKLPFTGVPPSGKLDTQVMQTSQHPPLVGDPAFQEFRTKSCKQGITGQALGMLGKVWASGVLQVVQDVAIVPASVHPRSKLEHLRKAGCGTGLIDLLAEIVYIPVYDETDPDTGVIAVLEVLIAARGRQSVLADVIMGVGNLLAELQLSLSKPDPDAEVPPLGAMPPVLIPSEPQDIGGSPGGSGPGSPRGPAASPFADAASDLDVFSIPEHTPVGSWQAPRAASSQLSSPVLSPRHSQLRSYGTPPNPLKYGSPPTAPLRYGFVDTPVLVPRPGSPLPRRRADVTAVMGDFASLATAASAPGGPLPTVTCGWAAVAAKSALVGPGSPPREGRAPAKPPASGLSSSLQGEVPPAAAAAAPGEKTGAWAIPRGAAQPPAKPGSLSRSLSRSSTFRYLDALEQDMPLPCPYTRAYSKPCAKGFAAQRPTLAAGM